MASTILVKRLLWDVCVALNDSAPQFYRWTEREHVDALNDGLLALAAYAPMSMSRIIDMRLKPGTLQSIESIPAGDYKVAGVDGAAALLGMQALAPICNMGGDGLTPGRPVGVGSRHTLDTTVPDWHSTTGAVIRTFVYDPQFPRQFMVQPAVPTGRNWLRFGLLAQPTAIPNTGTPGGGEVYAYDGASTLTVGVTDDYVADLLNYVLARAYMKNGAADRARVAEHTALFANSINAKAVAAGANNPNLKTLPFAPAPVGQAS